MKADGGAAKAKVIADLKDFGAAIEGLITSASMGLWQVYLGMAASVDGLRRFVRFMRATDEVVVGCVASSWDSPNSRLIAYTTTINRLYPVGVISTAEAAQFCPYSLRGLVADIRSTNRYGADSEMVVQNVAAISVRLGDMGVALNKASYEYIAKLASKGLGPNFNRFLDNVEAGRLGNMNNSANGMGRVLDNGDTAMDRFLEGIQKLPDGIPGETGFLRRIDD